MCVLLIQHVRNFLSLQGVCSEKLDSMEESTKLQFFVQIAGCHLRETVTASAADRGLCPADSCGEELTASSAPGSPADSPQYEEYYPALPRLHKVGSHTRPTISGCQSHWWYGFSFTAAPGGVQGRFGKVRAQVKLTWLWVSAGWRDFLEFVPFPCQPAAARSTNLPVKKGGKVWGGTLLYPWGCHQSAGFPRGVEALGTHTCEGTLLSSTQIIMLLSFAETSVLWTKSPSTGRPLLKASSWTLAVGFSSASFLHVNSSLIMSSNKITTFGSNNDHWLQEGATRARSPARHQSTLEPTRQRWKEVEKRG